MRTRLTVILLSLAAAALAGQAPQDRAQPPTFRAGANYVRVDMYATQDGRSVNDVRESEIEVLEDGTLQKIEDFEHVVVRPAGVDAGRQEVDGLRASREAASDPRARVFVIFLDTYHTQAFGSARMRQPLVRFLDRVLGPDDLVAVMIPEMAASDIALGRKTTVISKILTDEWWGRRGRIADEEEGRWQRRGGSSMRTSGRVPSRWPEETFDALALVDRRSEAWQPSGQPMSATTAEFSAQRGTCPCSARRCTAARS